MTAELDERGRGDSAPRPLLQATALHKHYARVHAVRGVDFRLDANHYVTLLGPSGCGKTTILRLIAGFETITSGQLELDGTSLLTLAAHRRPINTVFQSYALFPHLDVAENVAFGLAYKGLDGAAIARKVGDALALVQMGDLARRRTRELSGGQQQRVALARAVVNEPRLLLLDEPLSALDRRLRKDMQIELKDLQRRLGMTFLHVTHDQEEAFALSDRIIVMRDGTIEQEGPPTEIYRRPRTAYVADFIGGANRVPGHVGAVRDGWATIETALGMFEAPASNEVRSPMPATLCLRPEQLGMTENGPIDVSVTHIVYRGADWLVETRAADGTLLSFVMRNDALPELGARISLRPEDGAGWIAAETRGDR